MTLVIVSYLPPKESCGSAHSPPPQIVPGRLGVHVSATHRHACYEVRLPSKHDSLGGRYDTSDSVISAT